VLEYLTVNHVKVFTKSANIYKHTDILDSGKVCICEVDKCTCMGSSIHAWLVGVGVQCWVNRWDIGAVRITAWPCFRHI